jgi:serine phosphatase RsbU (regulator of sigma subunit)
MTFATQAAVALDNAARFEREQRIAQTFQRRLLPLVPRVKGIELAARYEPASPSAEVGGDLYDAILLDSRRLALAIGDVSGKGLDAATIMASTQYMMRGFLFQGMQPGEVLSSLQSAMIKELDPAQFVTIFLSVLDLETYELSYANAGHPFPIIITSEGCDSMIGHNSGPVGVPMSLGGARDRETEDLHWAIAEPHAYVTDRMTLPRDFGLVMYTDGMLDARSDGEFFGVERMLEICRQAGDASSDEIVERLLSAARRFTGGNLPDDIALLAARSPRLPAGPVTWDI